VPEVGLVELAERVERFQGGAGGDAGREAEGVEHVGSEAADQGVAVLDEGQVPAVGRLVAFMDPSDGLAEPVGVEATESPPDDDVVEGGVEDDVEDVVEELEALGAGLSCGEVPVAD
jgi:hypothetical protein